MLFVFASLVLVANAVTITFEQTSVSPPLFTVTGSGTLFVGGEGTSSVLTPGSRIQPSDPLSQALERNFYADETPVLHRQLHQRAEAEHQEFLALAQRSNLRLVKQYNEAKVRGRGG